MEKERIPYLRFYKFLTHLSMETEFTRALLQKIELLQNGEVSDLMKIKGISYEINYGASLQELKKLAASIESNAQKAGELRQSRVRELIILSFFIDTPEIAASEDLSKAVLYVNNIELAEISALYFFSKSPYAPEFCGNFIESENKYIQAAAYYTLIHSVKRNNFFSDENINEFIEKISRQIEQSMCFFLKIAANCFIVFASKNEKMKQKIENQLERLSKIHDDKIARAIRDTKEFIRYTSFEKK